MEIMNLQKYLMRYEYTFKYEKGLQKIFITDCFGKKMSIHELDNRKWYFKFDCDNAATRTYPTYKIYKILKDSFLERKNIPFIEFRLQTETKMEFFITKQKGE